MQFLDLSKFKTQVCPSVQSNSSNHNPKRCFFYHDYSKDRRRPFTCHTSSMCPMIKSAASGYKCPVGDACKLAHNRVEEFYHPEKYKTKFCQSYPDNLDLCEYGAHFCAFAHSEEELTIDLLHRMEPDADFYMFYFKTAWCPFPFEHDKE